MSVTDGTTYYTLQANENNNQVAGAAFSIQNPDTSQHSGGLPDFKVITSTLGNATANGVAAYPSLFVGEHYPTLVKNINQSEADPLENGGGSSGVNGGYVSWVTVADLEAASPSVTTSFDTSKTGVSGTYDTAYDVWFNSSNIGDQESGLGDFPGTTTAIPGTNLEMMIWLNASGVQPAGSELPGTVSIDGANWNVWWGQPKDNPHSRILTFVDANTATTSLNNIAIGDFAKIAAQDNSSTTPTLTSSWYLYDVEAGFEIYSGGQGLDVTNFSYLQCPATGCG